MLGDSMVVALIDIGQEEHAAEARASAELIQVLGHELLNGLAPIASLAESGLAAVKHPNADPALLRDILATLARRADGLQRFAEAYRSLARLPDPVVRAVAVAPMLADLARLFSGRWPGIVLKVEAPADLTSPPDRDQVSQAVWALLQNAAEAVADRPGGQVALTARGTDAGLMIDVVDNGPGILPDAAQRIFRPFHTTKPEGTGIGLSLARQNRARTWRLADAQRQHGGPIPASASCSARRGAAEPYTSDSSSTAGWCSMQISTVALGVFKVERNQFQAPRCRLDRPHEGTVSCAQPLEFA
jgi:signal transduction histidine kinase